MNALFMIRQAKADDAEDIAILLGQLGYPSDAEFTRQKIAELHGPHDAVLVADLEGQVVGVLGLHLIPTLHAAGFLGKVTALVVLDSYRGQGIARALLAEAEYFSAAAGALRMEVLSGNHRTEAHQFYRGAGYSTSDHSRFVRALV